MELQQLIGGVKLDELMSQLLEIYAHIEQVLTTRLPRGVWTDPGSKKGARQCDHEDLVLRSRVA